ncbi:MAG: glucose-6-phosphate isomerase [Armatimonadetes bacterium]|nr:glucose-6-phosphate isomerase [Armatimonadota bacterium]
MADYFNKLPIAIDAAYLEPNVMQEMIEGKRDEIAAADNALRSGTCPGAEFIGWLKPGEILAPDEIARIKLTAAKLAHETDIMLVIGIGGSYLGARAIIEALAKDPGKVVYAGQNISADYLTKLKVQLKGKRIAINVISKSGTTTEPAIAFRILKDLVSDELATEMIVATTDVNKGALLKMATDAGCEKFVVPDDIGGRFSALSAVGILPIAYAGISIDSLLQGASACAALCANTDPLTNPAYFYAAARNILYNNGIAIELMASFEPRLHFIAEWWKQLFGESEGKNHKGLFPAAVDYTTDLHSLGQYVQEGRRIIAETFLMIDEGEPSLTIPVSEKNIDGLNYLAGREVSWVNQKAYEATSKAHRDGGVPNMTIHLKKLDATALGALIYFFEIACAISGLMLGVNPFDQPGVEAYKKEMFNLLGKPGCGEAGESAIERKFISF